MTDVDEKEAFFPVEFNCASCGQSLEAPSDMAGEMIECPSCKTMIRIPYSSAIRDASPPAISPQSHPFSRQGAAQPQVFLKQPSPTQPTVGIKHKTEFIGVGALVQLIAIPVLFIAFPFGVFIGITMLVIGSRMALKHYCGKCGNKLDNKDVKMCPVCRATF